MAATIVFAISHLSSQLWLLFFNSEMEKQGTRVFFSIQKNLRRKREGGRGRRRRKREKNSKRLDKREKTPNRAGLSGAQGT